MKTEEERRAEQVEYCKNDVHDWRYTDGEHRECKECHIRHCFYDLAVGWVKEGQGSIGA